MDGLHTLFLKRIGIPQNEKITMETLDKVLEKTANIIPFENLRIITKRMKEINRDNLVEKILVNQEGGLCYELNTLFYLFLVENDFDVSMLSGVVYNQEEHTWSETGQTHVTILLTHKEQAYLIDTGFGSNLPLKPVPLNGETIVSNSGSFRVTQTDSEHGRYQLEFKLKDRDDDWKIGYAFDVDRPVKDVSAFNDIQTTIAKHPKSSFNQNPLLTRLTEEGKITLTDTTFTQRTNGNVKKEQIDSETFKKLAKQYFGLHIG